MCDFLRTDGLSIEVFKSLSFQNNLGRSLKNNLKSFPKSAIIDEISAAAPWYDHKEEFDFLALDYRVKSRESAERKYDRYVDANRPALKVFDDLLGFRSLQDSYDEILKAETPKGIRIVDMSNGKAFDDGYRGVHLYYQMDNMHYPIEVQYNTYFDRQLNNWLHKYLYKKDFAAKIGQQLRAKYEAGEIRNEEKFKEVLNHVLCCRETR